MEIIDGIYGECGQNNEREYFDRSKSYDYTKYRTIDEEKGLDFKIEWCDEDARIKTNTGRYS